MEEATTVLWIDGSWQGRKGRSGQFRSGLGEIEMKESQGQRVT